MTQTLCILVTNNLLTSPPLSTLQIKNFHRLGCGKIAVCVAPSGSDDFLLSGFVANHAAHEVTSWCWHVWQLLPFRGVGVVKKTCRLVPGTLDS